MLLHSLVFFLTSGYENTATKISTLSCLQFSMWSESHFTESSVELYPVVAGEKNKCIGTEKNVSAYWTLKLKAG